MCKADKIRLACYILALGIALVYPVRKIISFEYPSVPPKSYLFETEIYPQGKSFGQSKNLP